jgi:hypothetical protein
MDKPEMATDGEVSEADFAQFFAIAEDMRDEIVKAQRTIEKAVSGLVGKEHAEALQACSSEIARAIATMERLEERPQHDLQGTLNDIVQHLSTRPTRRPGYLVTGCVTLLLLLGVCIGWASKPRLFLSPVPQVLMQTECPGANGLGRKGGK